MSKGTEYDQKYSRYARWEMEREQERRRKRRSALFRAAAAAALCIAGILLLASRLDLEKVLTETVWFNGEGETDAFAEANTETWDPNGTEPENAAAGMDNGSEEGEALRFPEEAQEIEFAPHCTEATDPANLIASVEVEVNGAYYDYVSDYYGEYELDFGMGSSYTDAEGIVTFRGNNFRNNPAYGYADLSQDTLSGMWSKGTGGLSYGSASWTGSGWTGQPLLMKWPEQTKAHMNLYDWAKQKEDLVEVIYACMDGYIYFLDLETGEETRDALYLGYTFKGAGALDPRGYPILYVGAGYDSYEGTARVFVISLLDCSVLYTFGNNDPFSLRGSLSYFDSSALVDAETDTLIYPGENGIIYFIHLNTAYDETAGTLSIEPDRIAKWRYQGLRSSTASYWLGMESSAAIYRGYLYIADNGGHLMCLNINTMQLVWVQDILDDSNSTPVLSAEDGRLYLYVSTSFHLGWRSYQTASIPVWKIDAETGEILWQTEYECCTLDGVSGGVQSTIAVGAQELSDYIYVTVAMTGNTASGVLACLDKETGARVWEKSGYYTWSSPVCVYDESGKGRVIYCACDGNMYLIDGQNGGTLASLALSDGTIEASPAVYESCVVVGTRACKIWGVLLQ